VQKIVLSDLNVNKKQNFLKIFLVLFLVFVSSIYSPEKSFAEEKPQYTFKDMVQNFFINREKGIEAGEWIVLDEKLYMKRDYTRAHLLPDGNVLIFGGTGIRLKENSVEVYNPSKQKMTGFIIIDKDKTFNTTSSYDTLSLSNGDVYVLYETYKPTKYDRKTHVNNVEIWEKIYYTSQNFRFPNIFI